MSSPLKSMAESAASRFDQAANVFKRASSEVEPEKKPKISEKDSLVAKFEEILDLKLKPIEDKLDKIDPLTQQITALNERMSTMEANLQDQADQAVFIGMQKMHIPQQLAAMLGEIEQSLGQAKSDIVDLKVGGDDEMTGIDKIAEHEHELFVMKNEFEKLSKQGTSAVTQHMSIDLSKARKIRDAVAVRDKMSLIVVKSLQGVAPELVVDQILGDGVRKDTGMKVEKEAMTWAAERYGRPNRARHVRFM